MKKQQISIIDYVGQRAGMDYYTMSLAKAIAKNEIKVFVYSNFKKKNVEGVFTIQVFNNNTNNFFHKISDAVLGTMKAGFFAKLKKSDYIIMHLFIASYFSFFHFLVCRLLNKKIVTINHDVEGILSEKKWIRRMIINKLSWKVVVHNKFSEQQIIKLGLIKDYGKIHLIKHGGFLEESINQDKIEKDTALNYFNLEEQTKYILFFGQISEVKGLDILLRSLKHTKAKFKLIIAGKVGSNKTFYKYQKLIDELGIDKNIIKIIRFIEDHEMHKLFAIASIGILPYKKSYQSGVLLMAMSNNVPVLVSDLEPMKEIIKHNFNGMLFKSEDELDLAEKIDLFLGNFDENYKSFTANAIETIKSDYSWDEIGKQYVLRFNKPESRKIN